MNRRIGASNYLIAMSASVIAWSLGVLAACELMPRNGYIDLVNGVVCLLGVLLGVVFYAASTSRLRDLNFPRRSIHVLAFPAIGVFMLPVLCFLSGQRWENDYGIPQPRSGLFKVAVAVVLFLVASESLFMAAIAYDEVRREMSPAPSP